MKNRKIQQGLESPNSFVNKGRRQVLEGAVWSMPVVTAVTLPAHAKASGVTTTTTTTTISPDVVLANLSPRLIMTSTCPIRPIPVSQFATVQLVNPALNETVVLEGITIDDGLTSVTPNAFPYVLTPGNRLEFEVEYPCLGSTTTLTFVTSVGDVILPGI